MHCEKIVSDISEGLWLTITKVIPYFLPFLAIFEELTHGTKVIEAAPDKLNDIIIPLPNVEEQEQFPAHIIKIRMYYLCLVENKYQENPH